MIRPWVSVERNTNKRARLGDLPKTVGSVIYPIPTSVVPSGAEGILV